MTNNVTVLRLARLFRQLSISDVSHILKINASTISLLERNKIDATETQKRPSLRGWEAASLGRR